VQADRDAPRAAAGAILNEIAALARTEDAKTEPGKFVIPKKILARSRCGRIHAALRKLSIPTVTGPAPARAALAEVYDSLPVEIA
jgi:hypothetical protein